MKFQHKLNLIFAFTVMLLFVSCSSKDDDKNPIVPQGLAPNTVSEMTFEWSDPDYTDAVNPIYKITLFNNNSGKMTKNWSMTDADITTKSCVYTKTGANTAKITIEFELVDWGITSTFYFTLNFTKKDGGNCTWIEYMSNTDGSITENKIEGTFTLK